MLIPRPSQTAQTTDASDSFFLFVRYYNIKRAVIQYIVEYK